jgi:DNA-binding MarR family transcriptional regulator
VTSELFRGDPALAAQVESLLAATRVLVGLSVRTLGSVSPELTPLQLRALVLLGHGDGLPMGELAGALGVHPSNATRVCDRLVRLGLVRRRENPDDRRTLAAGLTPAGERVLASLMDVRRRALAEVLGALPVDRRAGLAADLDALVAAAGAAVPDGDLAALGWSPPRRG